MVPAPPPLGEWVDTQIKYTKGYYSAAFVGRKFVGKVLNCRISPPRITAL